jgi:hypothetical protein
MLIANLWDPGTDIAAATVTTTPPPPPPPPFPSSSSYSFFLKLRFSNFQVHCLVPVLFFKKSNTLSIAIASVCAKHFCTISTALMNMTAGNVVCFIRATESWKATYELL